VEQLVGHPVRAVEVEQRAQQHEVDQARHGDADDGTGAHGPPPAPVAQRVAGELDRGDGDEQVALDREVGDQAPEPGRQRRHLRLVEHAGALDHEHRLEHECGDGHDGCHEVDGAGAGGGHATERRGGGGGRRGGSPGADA
jgi:hypothetical protein